MVKGLFIMDNSSFEMIYGIEECEDIRRLADIYAPQQTSKSVNAQPSVLKDAVVIFSGWGGPLMDERFLNATPNLKVVFYGAGSIRDLVTNAFWNKGIRITSAYAANAIPVAEYTLSQILFCLKRGWHFAMSLKRDCKYPSHSFVPGVYRSTVGIISLGVIGCRVCELLKLFDVKIIAYDPFTPAETASALNVELLSLDEVFRRADVVSLHAPLLKETEGMITGEHLMSMKPYATFINTARGAIVRESEMIQVLEQRSDLQAVLDVTYPEPPEPGSALYTLPNVVVTPHIAGSMFGECRRMGRYMVEEFERYLNGQPMKWEIFREKARLMA